MPRVHTAKANKNYPDIGVKKGETYYWWKKRLSPKGSGIVIKSKTYPKLSQLTSSPFWSELHAIQEDADSSRPDHLDDVDGALDDIKGRLESLRDETQDKYDNMPEGLQQGDTGQMLEERANAIDDVINELDSVDYSFDEDDVEIPAEAKKAEREELIDTAKAEKLDEVWSQITDALSNISCS